MKLRLPLFLPLLLVAFFLAGPASAESEPAYHSGLNCQVRLADPTRSNEPPFEMQLRLKQSIPSTCPGCLDYDIFDAIIETGTAFPVSLGYYRRDWSYLANAADPRETYANQKCAAVLSDGAEVHLSMGTGDGGIFYCLSCSVAR